MTGIIRLEIAYRKSNLKRYFKESKRKREKAKRNGKKQDEISKIPIEYRTLDNYWNEEKVNKFILSEAKQYYYTGDYYKLNIAIKEIEKRENSYQKESWKRKLILFLCRINCVGIDRVKESGLYNDSTFRTYIKRLNQLNINPITIDEDSKYDRLESLYSLAKKTVIKKYFK